MTSKGIENVNPQRFVKQTKREVTIEEKDESVKDPIDEREIFDLLRDISDPEHPMSLEELNVVQITNIEVDDHENSVKVFYTPTIPHCSMATLIGLSIKRKLLINSWLTKKGSQLLWRIATCWKLSTNA
ncbi:MIP18 family protein galla-2 isoform X2 [Daphnia magna]|uniref:MIP18 family protein galla-2 isoform X2 n=1 Tax=Daphnia magna TaxID=35525 RepID=UPI001E1BA430|nr:MIP18 family protein galla-2 isoform X2 [Daphnia magna]